MTTNIKKWIIQKKNVKKNNRYTFKLTHQNVQRRQSVIIAGIIFTFEFLRLQSFR